MNFDFVLRRCVVLLMAVVVISAVSQLNAQVTARDIIDHANELLRGKTSYSEMEMKVVRAKWEGGIFIILSISGK